MPGGNAVACAPAIPCANLSAPSGGIPAHCSLVCRFGSGSILTSGAARYCVLPWNANSVGALNRLGLYHAQDRSLFLNHFLRPRLVRGRDRAISDGRYPRHGRAYDRSSKLSLHVRDEQTNPQCLPTVSAGRQRFTKSSADLSISLSTSAALQIAAVLSFS